MAAISGDLKGKRVVVLGLGLFGGGEGAARFLAGEGAEVTVLDERPAEVLRPALERLSGLPLRFRFGPHREEDFRGADLAVVNPAVGPASPWRAHILRRRIPWTTEMNLFLDRCPARVLAVTGTNGKSTTAALAAGLLARSGLAVWFGGNIGRSLLGAIHEIRQAPFDRSAVVLELSSFQLADLAGDGRTLAVSVVTNFSANHLDYHHSIGAYRAAKLRILARQDPEGFAVLNADDPEVATWPARARHLSFGTSPESDVQAQEGGLRVGSAARIPLEHVVLPGRHNRMNMAAAVAGAWALTGRSAPDPAWAGFLAGYPGLEHRLEFVREVGAARFYNDSKATTPAATATALASFSGGVVLIAGGRDKGADLDAFAAGIAAKARMLVATGECGARLREAALRAGCLEAVLKPDFTEAVRTSAESARPGEAVLLSPGCVSFDQFANYEERGKRFKEIVNSL